MSNFDLALRCARGCYQRNLITGYETLGGSTLRGRAKSYAGHYARSASNLLERLTAAGVSYTIQRGPRGGWHSARLIVSE